MAMNAPHEKLDREMQDNPDLVSELRRKIVTRSFPPAYYEHEVVRNHDGLVMPCALYLDGAPFSNRDGLVGIVVYNLLSFKRHLVAVYRRSNLCKCGCRGWCSFWPVFDFVRWSFAALGLGNYPEFCWDGTAWGEDHGHRKDIAGQAFVLPCCLLQIRGD